MMKTYGFLCHLGHDVPHEYVIQGRKRARRAARIETQLAVREDIISREQERLQLERELAPIREDMEMLLLELRAEREYEPLRRRWSTSPSIDAVDRPEPFVPDYSLYDGEDY